MLSDRRQRVLAALIEEYVANALPVGSRTLTERYQLGVSPATVRSELSALEGDGYISQPHTSAGRIPTEFGYRAFVDNLLETEFAASTERSRAAVDDLRAHATRLDSLLEETSATLARLTDCLSVVLAPSLDVLRIKQISLVSLSPRQAIIVVVCADGQVFNRRLEFDFDVSSDELASVQSLLGEYLEGRSLHDLESGLAQAIRASFSNPVMRQALEEVLACLHGVPQGHSHRLGMSALLAQPEFEHSDAVVPLMRVLEDDTVLLQLLDDATSGEGDVSVRIGSENHSDGLRGVSVVASRYGYGDAMGVVAVIGPTRMNYSNVMHAVRAARSVLDSDL